MIEFGDIIRVGQIIFAALVAIVPPFYPTHSIYSRRALHGIECLWETRKEWEDGELGIGWIERGEKGFSQLLGAILHEKGEAPRRVSRIGLVYGGQSELEEFIGFSPGTWVGNNAVMFAEYKNGDRTPIIFHPFDPNTTLNLTELERWVRSNANRRANYWAGGLAVIWSSLALASTF